MCHIHRLWYSCDHGDLVLLSKCRATRSKVTRKKSPNFPCEECFSWKPIYTKENESTYQKAACKHLASLNINLRTRCGVCLFSVAKENWDKKIAQAKNTGGALSEDFERLNEERDRVEWECRKMFPPERKTTPNLKLVRKEKVYLGSPLKKELKPEDVEEVSDMVSRTLSRIQLLHLVRANIFTGLDESSGSV